jgi:flagellar hook-associated protein 3 FlgL
MIARVTQATWLREVQAGIGRLERRLLDAQATVSSQKKLRAPSDDPAGTARAGRLRGEVTQLSALGEGVGFGTAILGAEDAALDQAQAILTRAREIATQHAGELSSAAARQSAEEVAELERDLLALGNTAIAGRHVFGGLATGSAPFTGLDEPGFDPATTYTGPADPFFIRIGSEETIRLSTPGDQVFGQAIAAVDALRQTLTTGAAPVGSLDDLEAAAETLRLERSSVGGRLTRLTNRDQEIGAAVDGRRQLLASIEDADLTESVIQLVQLQSALEAALAASSRLLETSILDFVRL